MRLRSTGRALGRAVEPSYNDRPSHRGLGARGTPVLVLAGLAPEAAQVPGEETGARFTPKPKKCYDFQSVQRQVEIGRSRGCWAIGVSDNRVHDMSVETETLTAALAGEREAMGRVLVACSSELRLHLSGRVGVAYQSAVSIDDVIQVTFVEACLRIRDLENRTIEGLGRWLKSIADHNLTDAVRELNAAKRPPRQRQRIAASREESAATFLANLTGSDTTPTQGAHRAEFAMLLDSAMHDLPPDYEKAIRLYDLENKQIHEVAAAFDPPRGEGAVHMLRARGRERLRELLGDTKRFF